MQNYQDVYFSDSSLIAHCQNIGSPLPFSLSALRKDRVDGRLGVPFRRLGGAILYRVDDVFAHLARLPIIQPKRPTLQQTRTVGRRGKPRKTESVAAKKLGISVKELRLKNGGAA